MIRVALSWLMLCATPPVAWGAEDPQGIYFSADADIDASGRAIVSDMQGVRGVLADLLAEQLQARAYQPATSGGMPVSSRTRVYATAVLTPSGSDDMVVSVQGLATGPWMPRLIPPMYPGEMASKGVSGSALVTFTIGADGRAENVRMDATDARIEQSLKRVVPRWRFKPQIIAGQPSNEEVAVPVWLHPWGDVSGQPTFACPAIGSRPHVDAHASGCLERIEVTFQK